MGFKCIYCFGDKFYQGPSGGGSINLLCSNPECRHWFNDEGMGGELYDLQKVEPTDKEKQELKEKEEKETKKQYDDWYDTGKCLFWRDGSLRDVLSIGDIHYYVSPKDLDRNLLIIAGFCDAMKEDHIFQVDNLAKDIRDLR